MGIILECNSERIVFFGGVLVIFRAIGKLDTRI